MPEYLTVEPKKRGARIADRDGRIWVRGTRLWADHTGTGDDWRGRLPWDHLVTRHGPLTDGARFEQHKRDEILASLSYLPDAELDRHGPTRAEVDAAIAREAEWNAPLQDTT